MRIHIPFFGGEKPAIPAQRLEDYSATRAMNCLLDDQDLTPLIGPLTLQNQPALPATVKKDTIYLYERDHWFVFSNDVDLVPSPIIEDPYARIYFTGDGAPKVTTNEVATGAGVLPAASFLLGVPKPSVAPVVKLVSGEQDDPEGIDDDESRFYVYTYVTATGEESAPSDLSNKLVLKTPLLDKVEVTVSPPANNLHNITHINIYRSASSAEDAFFMSVVQVPISTTKYTDALLDAELGPLLETDGYLPPPEDLHGLVGLSGGMLAGFSGRNVCISEAYLPYAWPQRYQQKTEWPIVGIVAVQGGAVVCTEGEPYLLQGTAPDSMLLENTGTQQACVSKRSIVAMDGFVLYASPDGMVMVNGSGAELISTELIKPKQWRELNPQTIHAYYHESEYIAFYKGSDGVFGGFILNPQRRDIRFFDFYASAGYRDLATDSFYILVNGSLKKWADGSAMPAKWKSKEFVYPDSNFSLCKVSAPDISGVQVLIFADGKIIHSQTLSNEHNGVFWLPSGLHNRWQVQINTIKPINSITLATSYQELG